MARLVLLLVFMCLAGSVLSQGDPFCQFCNPWQPWQQCSSQICGVIGTRSRSRSCSQNTFVCSSSGPQPCSAPMSGICCPCTGWAPSGQCFGNFQRYSRTCDPICANTVPVGQRESTRPCSTTGGTGWSNWSGWSVCSATCGFGQHTRTRTCINQVSGNCQGLSRETQSCNTFVQCPTTGGTWGAWNQFGACSASCIPGGSRFRTRHCSTGNPANCFGDGQQFIACNTQVPCTTTTTGWSHWSAWNFCSSTCAGGHQTRTRTCNSVFGNCQGLRSETQSCNSFITCTPTTGGHWMYWSQWTACTRTCTGRRIRHRFCSVPGTCSTFEFGGVQVEDCNEHIQCVGGACVCPQWAGWGNYGGCTAVTCGAQGTRTRARQCVSSGITCSDTDTLSCTGPCTGGGTGSDGVCNESTCTQWSQWTHCVNCGSGQSMRHRSCQGDMDCAIQNNRNCPCTG